LFLASPEVESLIRQLLSSRVTNTSMNKEFFSGI